MKKCLGITNEAGQEDAPSSQSFPIEDKKQDKLGKLPSLRIWRLKMSGFDHFTCWAIA
jgi:hypothetical protein